MKSALAFKYSGKDLALLIPTKDRPEKIVCLLQSILEQNVACGRIIIVDGGISIREVVISFAAYLPVEYYVCNPPGQIRQRNMGVALLDDSTPLVGCLDDDIVLLPNALEKMLECWNRSQPKTAGISFNIINMHPIQHNWFKGLIGLTGPQPGRVLKSGCNTPITCMSADTNVDWLCGGATVWKANILKKHNNREIQAKWAPLEDLIFSYPLGKLYPLMVCASSHVRHEHVYDRHKKVDYYYIGKTETLWKFYFVEMHFEISRVRFLILQSLTLVARIFKAVCNFQIRHLQFALGQILGVLLGIRCLLSGRKLFDLLNEPLAD